MRRTTLLILVAVLAVLALSTGAKLYAVVCYGEGWGDCSGFEFECIPHERDWEAHGNDGIYTCYCDPGAGGYPECREDPTDQWCTSFYTCDDECDVCEFNEENSASVNVCIFD